MKKQQKLLEIYNIMLRAEGYRNWWPSESILETVVGAIFTQFVSWSNVETALVNLKKNNMLNVKALADADEQELGKLIISTRFYSQKAKKIKLLCNYLIENYEGKLEKLFVKNLYELRKELLSLYGIGEETADSIILYAAFKPIFVVDAYTRRIFSRIGLIKEDASYSEIQKLFMDNLEHNVELFNDYHAQIVHLGNKYCKNKKPECKICPINLICKKRGV